jgi:hypothetical protein
VRSTRETRHNENGVILKGTDGTSRTVSQQAQQAQLSTEGGEEEEEEEEEGIIEIRVHLYLGMQFSSANRSDGRGKKMAPVIEVRETLSF